MLIGMGGHEPRPTFKGLGLDLAHHIAALVVIGRHWSKAGSEEQVLVALLFQDACK